MLETALLSRFPTALHARDDDEHEEDEEGNGVRQKLDRRLSKKSPHLQNRESSLKDKVKHPYIWINARKKCNKLLRKVYYLESTGPMIHSPCAIYI